jgi:hypothetical protein
MQKQMALKHGFDDFVATIHPTFAIDDKSGSYLTNFGLLLTKHIHGHLKGHGCNCRFFFTMSNRTKKKLLEMLQYI